MKKKEAQEDNPLTGLPLVDKFFNLRSYLSTKRYVEGGGSPWEYSIDERQKKNILGPWETNFYESFLCSIPWVLLFWLLGLFFETHTISGITEEQQAVINIYKQIDSVTVKIITPLFIMMLAWVAGYASLKSEDLNPESRKRSVHAYLYLDGSYGFIPQCLVVLGISLVTFVNSHKLPDQYASSVTVVGMIIIGISLIWSFRVVAYKIPKMLFSYNGYSSSKPKHFRWFRNISEDPNMGPWNRYEFWLILTAGFGFWGIIKALSFAQLSLAEFIVSVRL